MPPKRGKKAAAKPALDGCILALSGTFPGATHAAIKAKAEALGATVATSITGDVTHLVTTDNDYKKPSPKVAKAQSLGTHIVSLDWLLACETNNAREAEKDYAFGKPAAGSSAQPDTSNPTSSQNGGATATADTKTRKRASSPVADDASENDAAPKRKRTRGQKAEATQTDGDNDVKMEDANDAADTEAKESVLSDKKKATEKAVGEGQVAKSKDIQIPLDEGCPFTGYKVYIDDSGVIYDASLNQTNASHNNNKFYRLQVRSLVTTRQNGAA